MDCHLKHIATYEALRRSNKWETLVETQPDMVHRLETSLAGLATSSTFAVMRSDGVGFKMYHLSRALQNTLEELRKAEDDDDNDNDGEEAGELDEDDEENEEGEIELAPSRKARIAHLMFKSSKRAMGEMWNDRRVLVHLRNVDKLVPALVKKAYTLPPAPKKHAWTQGGAVVHGEDVIQDERITHSHSDSEIEPSSLQVPRPPAPTRASTTTAATSPVQETKLARAASFTAPAVSLAVSSSAAAEEEGRLAALPEGEEEEMSRAKESSTMATAATSDYGQLLAKLHALKLKQSEGAASTAENDGVFNAGDGEGKDDHQGEKELVGGQHKQESEAEGCLSDELSVEGVGSFFAQEYERQGWEDALIDDGDDEDDSDDYLFDESDTSTSASDVSSDGRSSGGYEGEEELEE